MTDRPTDLVRRRLEAELADLAVPDVDAALVDELAHAMRRHVHEGVLAGYGALVLSPGQATATGFTAGRTEFENPERLRQLADGRTSFIERIGDDVSLWLAPGPVSEVDLVTTCRDRGARAVRLDPDGRLHLVDGEQIWSRRRAQWQARPTAPTIASRLADGPGRPGETAVLQGLCELVAHVLGPRDVGATIVWLPDWERQGCETTLPNGGSTPLLSVRDRTLDDAVTNLLRQHDGAALVSPDGALWWVGAELSAPAAAGDVPPIGGMRHRSAARFARVRPDAWVFVVSHDGPVSVFVGGQDALAVAAEGHRSPDGGGDLVR